MRIDVWALANCWTGGHSHPENRQLVCVTPLQFHRRQLHRLEPERGGVRKPYGGTNSLGMKRGALVKHPLRANLCGGSHAGENQLACARNREATHANREAG